MSPVGLSLGRFRNSQILSQNKNRVDFVLVYDKMALNLLILFINMTKWRIIMSGLPVSCRCRIPADQIVIDSVSWRQHPLPTAHHGDSTHRAIAYHGDSTHCRQRHSRRHPRGGGGGNLIYYPAKNIVKARKRAVASFPTKKVLQVLCPPQKKLRGHHVTPSEAYSFSSVAFQELAKD